MSWPLQGLVASKRWGNTTRRLMALTLSSVANDDGSGIFASVKTMARDSEISESTARRTIQDFEAEGILSKVGTRPCLNGYTNVWLLNVAAIKAMEDLKPEKTIVETTGAVTGVSKRNRSRAEPGSPRHQTTGTVTDNPIQDPITLPPVVEVEKVSETKQQRIRATTISRYVDYAPEYQAVAAKHGLLNGNGERVFRKFAGWFGDREIKHTDWLLQFDTWCANERAPEQRETHDERTHQIGDTKLVAANNRARVARRTKALGSSGGGGGIVGAALRRKAKRAAQHAEQATSDEPICVEYAVVA